MKKNGKNQSYSQKLKCNDCNHCFVERKIQRIEKVFRSAVWFQKYISEGYSIRQISEQSGITEHFVRTDIQSRLD